MFLFASGVFDNMMLPNFGCARDKDEDIKVQPRFSRTSHDAGWIGVAMLG